MSDDVASAKRELRRRMRAVRADLIAGGAAGGPTIEERSAPVVGRLTEALSTRFAGVPGASGSAGRPSLRRVMAYDAVPGEVDLGNFVRACQEHEIEVACPPAEPGAVAPRPAGWADVIVVPGLAFDRRGGRLGQGGGWYDRYLADPHRTALIVGIGFAAQVVESVPVDDHDVILDCVATEDAAWWA